MVNDNDMVTSDVDDETVVVEEETIDHFEIDTRRPEWCWQPIKLFEVCDAIEKEHEEDVTKSVEPMGRERKSLMGIFRLDSDDYQRYVDKSLEIRGVKLPITPRHKTRNNAGPTYQPRERREGTLITIYGAYRRDYRYIDNSHFDKVFQELGLEIIKLTQPQTIKGTSILNNNRYLVVENLTTDTGTKDIGTYIRLMGLKFDIQYTGMTKYCYRCLAKHGWDCPIQARHNFLREQRKGLNSKRKIYSDSIFRCANQVALTTDVGCMTGGGLGQVINAIKQDVTHEETIINAGTNEILHTESLTEFVYTVEKSIEKVKELAANTNVTLILPSMPTNTVHEICKAKYFGEKLKEVEEIKVIELSDIEYESTGKHLHPTVDGTKTMIQQLDVACSNEVILPDAETDEIATTRKYRQVHTLYKVGCRGCSTFTGYTSELCETCRMAAEHIDVTYITEMLNKVNEEFFPSTSTTNEGDDDVNMKEIVKRVNNDDENGESQKAKMPRK